MSDEKGQKDHSQDDEINVLGTFWPVFLLNGFYSISWGGIIFLIVPISRVIWPNEPAHALEIGIIITTLAWSASFSGLIWGRLIDLFSRVNIMFIIALIRGFAYLMLGFSVYGGGFSTWIYFLIFVGIMGLAAGGHQPSVISFWKDVVATGKR